MLKKITFIRPSIHGMRSSDAMEPLAFAILAGLTPPDIEVVLYDERVEDVPLDEATDLVALTVETYTARRAYQLATHYRRRGVPVVMGGYHVSFLPDEALGYADAVVVGDAEGVWGQVIEDAGAGRLQRRYQQVGQPPLKGLRFERRIFQGKRYTPVAPVQYGRGCRFACDFCSIHAFYGTTTRQRPVAEVVAEIEALGRRYVLLVDDNIFVDMPRAQALFKALIPLRIRWGCQVSIDIARDEALLDLMARSGCIGALIGFESLEAGSLRQMKKGWNLKSLDYLTAIQRFQARGIMIYGSFVFGYDHDTLATFESTVAFAQEAKLFLVNFNALNPMPGSGLYARLQKEGRLLYHQWWLHPDYRYGEAAFQPQQMSVAELTAGCLQARRAFYSVGSIVKRLFEPRTNCRTLGHVGVYLGANLISRRELSRKLGRRLGGEMPLEVASI